MSRAVHAAEDVLSAVRTGDRPVTQALIGDCLSCLDQVVQWLDTIQDSGNLPGGAEADADRVVARFTADPQSTGNTKAAPIATANGASAILPTRPVAVLKEQLSLLAAGGDGAEGRIASAGRLAANVLRHIARADEAEEVERALLQSRTSRDFTLLTAAIERAVEHITEPMPAEAVPAFAPRAASTSCTLRVDPERVNDLVNVTGELMVARRARFLAA
jgi:two-component system chemotaxis sensor kinase CheA